MWLLLMTELLNSLLCFCFKYFISPQKISAANQHLMLCIIDEVEIFEHSDLFQTMESSVQSVLNPCSFFKTPCISCTLRASCRCEQKWCS